MQDGVDDREQGGGDAPALDAASQTPPGVAGSPAPAAGDDHPPASPAKKSTTLAALPGGRQ
jgi:hypothetical protein